MSYNIEFLEDFATFKKGDTTDKISGDIVANLINRGIGKRVKNLKDIEVKAETVKAEKPIINKKPGRKAKK